MDEIRELQRQLAEVQQTNTNKLSDRVIIDLLSKITKDFNFNLISSLDGNEYVTPQFLTSQMYDIVRQRGRISILDLPNILNVGLDKIEKQINAMCHNNNNNQSQPVPIFRLGDSLFTGYYLDGVCEQIAEELSHKSHISISEISNQFSLSPQFISSEIEKRMGKGSILEDARFNSEKDKSKIVTVGFSKRIEARLRGLLCGCLRPIAISSIAKEIGMELEGSTETLQNLIEEQLQKGSIEGVVMAGAFTPARFIKDQEQIVRNFFNQNRYIEYDMMSRQLLIAKPKEYLKGMFKNSCIFLETLCFNKEALDALAEQVDSMLQSEGYADLERMLPAMLSQEEVHNLVRQNMKFNSCKVELHGSFVFDVLFVDKCAAKFKERLIQHIYHSPQTLIHEDTQQQASPAKKTGKSKAKTNKKSSSEANANGKTGMFSKDEVVQVLVQNKLVNQDDLDDRLESALEFVLRSKIASLYEEVKGELFESAKSSNMAELISQMQRKLEYEGLNLISFVRSNTVLDEKYSGLDIKGLHETALDMSRKLGEHLLVFVCKKQLITLPEQLFVQIQTKQQITKQSYEEHSVLQDVFKDQAAKQEAVQKSKLPKEFKVFFQELDQYLKEKRSDKFVECLTKHAQELLNLKIYKADKKIDKNFFYFQKHALMKEIKGCSKEDDKGLLYFTLHLLLLQKSNLYVVCHGGQADLALLMLICIQVFEQEGDATLKGQIKRAFELINAMKALQENEAFFAMQSELHGCVQEIEAQINL